MEKKKYIQKEEVSDIMDHLTERVLKNTDKVTLEINVRRFIGDTTLDAVVRSNRSHKTLAKETYIIIDKLNDAEDVFDAGLAAWEKEQAEQEAEESTTNEIES